MTNSLRRPVQAAFLLLCSMAAHAGEYHLGQGYTTGNINIAGYLNVVLEDPSGKDAEFLVDDLSLFISGRFNKYLNPFFEFEISGANILHDGSDLFPGPDPDLILERLYNDSYLTETMTLRVGKMLSPVGEWNTIHAAPLVWTTSRPMTTKRSFSEYVSGVSLSYAPQNPMLPELQVYWQPGDELRPKPSEKTLREYHNVSGAHLNWSIGLNDKAGLSLQHAEIIDSDETQTLAGFNYKKTLGKFQFETEATYTRLHGDDSSRVRDEESGIYLLGAYALTDALSLVARQEYFLDRNEQQSSRNSLLGLTYRPHPAIVWKAEYINNSGAVLDSETGLYASFSVLF